MIKFAIQLLQISQNGWYYYQCYVQFMFRQFRMIDTFQILVRVRPWSGKYLSFNFDSTFFKVLFQLSTILKWNMEFWLTCLDMYGMAWPW